MSDFAKQRLELTIVEEDGGYTYTIFYDLGNGMVFTGKHADTYKTEDEALDKANYCLNEFRKYLLETGAIIPEMN